MLLMLPEIVDCWCPQGMMAWVLVVTDHMGDSNLVDISDLTQEEDFMSTCEGKCQSLKKLWCIDSNMLSFRVSVMIEVVTWCGEVLSISHHLLFDHSFIPHHIIQTFKLQFGSNAVIFKIILIRIKIVLNSLMNLSLQTWSNSFLSKYLSTWFGYKEMKGT